MVGSVRVYFGGWLRQRRREAGVGQDTLADRLGCSASTLQKIETGERRPSRQMILLIADLFHVPVDEREAFVTFARTSASDADSDSRHPQPSLNTQKSENTPRAQHLPQATQVAQQPQAAQAPWRAAHLRHNNLPVALNSFIGREHEEQAVCDLLSERAVRLVTLVGAPGIGKTRLGIEVAGRPDMAEQFEDGIFMVELAPITDRELVIPAIATTFGLKETSGQTQSLEEVLLQYLQDKRMLLVLDNFEQVLDAAPGVVGLLARSPWLKVLVTSREALHVRGERRFHVPPLELPHLPTLSGTLTGTGTPDVQVLSANPAVALFVERAQEAVSDFDLTQENAADVAAVCVGLDGLPLAIELAAARVDALSAKEMQEGLGSRLKLLTKGARDLPARQRTLQAAIEWSYALLGEDEQRLFRRMAVFRGGRTVEALQEVCNYDGKLGLEVDVQNGVEKLVGRSLLEPRRGKGGEALFWMLETIHEYAREKLQESGETGPLQREHALYFMRLAEEAEKELRSVWLDRLEEEHDNVRAAMHWAIDSAESGPLAPSEGAESAEGAAGAEGTEAIEILLRIGGALHAFWITRGHLSDGRTWLGGLLGLTGLVGLQGSNGPLQGRCSQIQPQLRVHMSKALRGAGSLAMRQGDLSTARTLFEESLSLAREIGDKATIATSLRGLGTVAYEQGNYSTARALDGESLSLAREIGDKMGIASSLGNLGIQAYEQEDYSTARSLLEESLALYREIGDKMGIANMLSYLGALVYERGDYSTACALHEESLAIRRELGDTGGIAEVLVRLGSGAAGAVGAAGAATEADEPDKEEAKRVARVLGAVEAMLESIGLLLERGDRLQYERAVTSARALLCEEEFEKAWQEGRAMSMEEAIEYALQASAGNQS